MDKEDTFNVKISKLAVELDKDDMNLICHIGVEFNGQVTVPQPTKFEDEDEFGRFCEECTKQLRIVIDKLRPYSVAHAVVLRASRAHTLREDTLDEIWYLPGQEEMVKEMIEKGRTK